MDGLLPYWRWFIFFTVTPPYIHTVVFHRVVLLNFDQEIRSFFFFVDFFLFFLHHYYIRRILLLIITCDKTYCSDGRFPHNFVAVLLVSHCVSAAAGETSKQEE